MPEPGPWRFRCSDGDAEAREGKGLSQGPTAVEGAAGASSGSPSCPSAGSAPPPEAFRERLQEANISTPRAVQTAEGTASSHAPCTVSCSCRSRDHRLWGLNQTPIFSWFCKASLSQGVSRATLLSALGENLFLASPSCWGLQAVLGLRPHHSLFPGLLLTVSVSPLLCL